MYPEPPSSVARTSVAGEGFADPDYIEAGEGGAGAGGYFKAF